jgi:hypothetical protein
VVPGGKVVAAVFQRYLLVQARPFFSCVVPSNSATFALPPVC